MQTTMTVKNGLRLGFSWEGGPYIDVCIGQNYGHPKEVINVWNYETGKPELEFTRDAFRAKIKEWMDDYGRDDLYHDVTENWRWF